MEKQEKNQNRFSARKRLHSFKYAFKGIKNVVFTQHNIWIHLVAAAIVIFLGIVLQISIYEWCLVIFAMGFVLVAEIFNTAIEFLVDFISPGYDKKAGVIKDIVAGGVLVSAITAAIIGLLVFIPKIMDLL